MQIVVPMAGVGKRFIDAGYSTPKPLIEVDGLTMIEHVINMFPGEEDYLFICNEEHLKQGMGEQLLKLKPQAKIVGLKYEKRGPVWGVLQAQEFVKNDQPVIINYCDFFQLWDYAKFKQTMQETGCAGAVMCYTGFHPHLLHNNVYAGVLADEKSFMTHMQEKHRFTKYPMASWHSSGGYYFKSGALAKDFLKKTMAREDLRINGEHYISTVYQLLLDEGMPVYVYPLDQFLQWGTPADLEEYNMWSDAFKN